MVKNINEPQNQGTFYTALLVEKKVGRPNLEFLLKELADDESFFLICYALFHHDAEISIGASLVLGHLRDSRALAYLLRALLTTDLKRAEAVMWALGEIGDEISVPFLLKAINARFAIKSAILALGKIGSKAIAGAMLKSLADQDEAVRVLAAKALSQVRFDDDFETISSLLPVLKSHLTTETSRRVKLMVAVTCSRLEKTMESARC
ncbi:MAG TPA: HEAT repeat domain-containing protein [Myxococcota bacterium]|nr:HEAT repeat domain-containing protein [Myxococcota bacterium]